MKKSLAVMLALIMVLCMIPTTAFAADIIDQKNKVYIYKGEPQNSYFLRQIDGGSITKSKNEEVIWQRLPRYTSKCGRCNNVVEEVIPDLYCINPDKNIEITNPEVIGEYGVRVASWKGNDVYNGYPCFEFYCKAAKAGETDVKVTYYYNYNYRGASGYCNYCGNFVYVQAQTNWYKESVTFHVTCETQEPPKPENTPTPSPAPSESPNPQPSGNITIEVSKVWHDNSNTVPKPEKITVNLLKNGTVVENAPIMPDNKGTWFHRFDNMPANDINDNPINYTVKEENVPDWTPYYYTAGLWKGKLIFQIHNVLTENTREIKVAKKVSGEGADKTKEFDFTITLLEYHDNAEVTSQPGYYPLSGICTVGGVTFTNGEAAFKLKDGESFTITGIPNHLQYKVEEDALSGYTVKVNGSTGSSISGAFTDAKTVDITFENVKESGTNPTPSPSTDPSPTPTPTPGGGNGGGHSHYHPYATPVPVIVIPPKTGDMTIWQSILHFLGIR